MADYLIHDSTLEDIADAIRSKTSGSAVIAPEDMPEEIASIETGGGDYTLLGEYEITEPVSAINFNASEQVKKCNVFVFILDNVEASAPDYIRLNIDGYSQSYRNLRQSTYSDFKIIACLTPNSQIVSSSFFWDWQLSAGSWTISSDWSYFQLRFLQGVTFTTGTVRFYGR